MARGGYFDKLELRAWLHRQLYLTDDDLGPCTKIVCRHVSQGDGRKNTGEVFRIDIPHSEQNVSLDDGGLDDVVMQVESQAQSDAEGLGGVQQYAVYAHYAKQKQPGSRFVFRLEGSDMDIYAEGMESEPATGRGHLSQMMRHNEQFARIAVIGANQTINSLLRQNSRQSDQIEKLIDQKFETFEMMEKLKSREKERELMEMDYQLGEERKQAMFDKVNLLIPVVVNRIAGRKILAESISATEELFKTWCETLTAIQIQEMMPKLTPDQQLAFFSFMERIAEGSEKKPPQLPGPRGNGKQ